MLEGHCFNPQTIRINLCGEVVLTCPSLITTIAVPLRKRVTEADLRIRHKEILPPMNEMQNGFTEKSFGIDSDSTAEAEADPG